MVPEFARLAPPIALVESSCASVGYGHPQFRAISSAMFDTSRICAARHSTVTVMSTVLLTLGQSVRACWSELSRSSRLGGPRGLAARA